MHWCSTPMGRGVTRDSPPVGRKPPGGPPARCLPGPWVQSGRQRRCGPETVPGSAPPPDGQAGGAASRNGGYPNSLRANRPGDAEPPPTRRGRGAAGERRRSGVRNVATLDQWSGVGPQPDLVDHHRVHGDGVAARPVPLRVGSADQQVEVLLVGALAVRPLECAAELRDRGEVFVQERGGSSPGTDGRGERGVEQLGGDA
jgi:hypothetical protein